MIKADQEGMTDFFVSLIDSWGTVTFANQSDCRSAERDNGGKMIKGRPIRVEIQNGKLFL